MACKAAVIPEEYHYYYPFADSISKADILNKALVAVSKKLPKKMSSTSSQSIVKYFQPASIESNKTSEITPAKSKRPLPLKLWQKEIIGNTEDFQDDFLKYFYVCNALIVTRVIITELCRK